MHHKCINLTLLQPPSAIGHHSRIIQTIAENVYVWSAGPRCPVSELCTLMVPTINLFTYLLTYFGLGDLHLLSSTDTLAIGEHLPIFWPYFNAHKL